MTNCEKGDTIRFAAYTPARDAEEPAREISWQQKLMTKKAKFYEVAVKNVTRDKDTMIYIQDRFYKDESSPDFVGKLPGIKKEGDDWVVTVDDHFQYGQKNEKGDDRWLALQDKSNKMFQHRFIVATVQGKAAGWATTMASRFGARDIAEAVNKVGPGFVGHSLHDF